MDFITGLPKAQGRDCIYVVVDRLTKYAHFFPITTTYSTAQVAEVFLERFLDYMVCLGTLWVTGTAASWVTCGRRYSFCVQLSLHLALVITHRIMVKWILWKNGWKGIWEIMWQINSELGLDGYISVSIATILHTIWLYKWHPSWNFIVMRHLVS